MLSQSMKIHVILNCSIINTSAIIYSRNSNLHVVLKMYDAKPENLSQHLFNKYCIRPPEPGKSNNTIDDCTLYYH